MWEYDEALGAYEVAQNHFENAAPDYIETAIFELAAAEKRIEAALRMLKRERNHVEG